MTDTTTITVALTALAGAVTALVGVLAWGLRFGLRKLFGPEHNGGGHIGKATRILTGMGEDLRSVEVRLRANVEQLEGLRDHLQSAAAERASIIRNLETQTRVLRELVEHHQAQEEKPT